MPSAEFDAAVEKIRNAPLPDRSLPIAEQRLAYERASQYPMPPGATAAAVEADGVACEWVVAPGADPARRLMHLHGGGYVLGNANTHRDLAAIFSQETGAAALFVDYRLAPEHPFPAAAEDAVAAYRFMLANGPDGPGAAADAYIVGESAGGGLTLATLLTLRDAGDRMPNAAAAIAPWTDLALSGDSYRTNADRDIRLSLSGLRGMAAAYLNGADPRTPLASPLYGDPRGLPPLLLQVGEPEVLLDDTRAFTRRARAAGVAVTEEVWPDMFHVWHHQWATLPEARQAVQRIGAFCKARAGARV